MQSYFVLTRAGMTSVRLGGGERVDPRCSAATKNVKRYEAPGASHINRLLSRHAGLVVATIPKVVTHDTEPSILKTGALEHAVFATIINASIQTPPENKHHAIEEV